MIENTPFVVTIDGPGGSGKGSVALKVAAALNFHYLDSGAFYRLAALKALRKKVNLENQKEVLDAIQPLNIRFEAGEESSKVFLDAEDVSNEIRAEQVGNAASVIAAYADVRGYLLNRQVQCFQPPGLVADGRDMGTVVFPQAKFKIYLYASPEIRAQRRYKQLINMGISANIAQLQQDIDERDERDRNRRESPMLPAEKAIVVDSSLLDLNQVTDLILSHIRGD